jgi:hypothetical protein
MGDEDGGEGAAATAVGRLNASATEMLMIRQL